MNTPHNGNFAPPRNGSVMMVLIIARISTVLQDRRSLADQRALCEAYVKDRYKHPFEVRLIEGQGSGEYLDRKDLLDAEEAVVSCKYDLVVVEDIGRICRRNRAVDFCESCEDANTRLISINDSIDTANDDWRLHAFFASFKHESSNKDTAKRIRRSLQNRFMQGTILKIFPYGYIKPPGAKTDAEVYKDPLAIPVMDQIFLMLENDASYEEVACWLNQNKVPLSRWARRTKWYGGLVVELVFNPILKGVRRWNERVSRRINKTGRRRNEKAPVEENLFREVPHLAFFEAERYDRLIVKLKRRGEKASAFTLARLAANGNPSQPRKPTVWPGHHAICGVCGRKFVWGGHGPPENMICSGVRDYSCWNVFSFNGHEAGPLLLNALWQLLENMPAFDIQIVEAVRASAKERRSSRKERLRSLDDQIVQVSRQLDNVAGAIANVGNNPTLQAKLIELGAEKQQLLEDHENALGEAEADVEIPTPESIRNKAREVLANQDFGDPRLGRMLRQLLPTIRVYPVQALDGGEVYQRAYIEVLLVPLVGQRAEELTPLLRGSMVVDLFPYPQRIKHMALIMRRIAEGGQHRKIASELGIDQAAVQRARALNNKMKVLGTTDPLSLVKEPPVGTKMRRTQHQRYEFQPLPGFPEWPE